jgi:hypothetical protein
MSFPFVQPYFGLGNSLQTAQAGGAGGIGGWVELARTTLGSAGDTINVSSLPDKRYYMVLADLKASGYILNNTRFNSDSGNNYAWRRSLLGATDGTTVSTNFISQSDTGAQIGDFSVDYITNLSAKEKLTISHVVENPSSGAGTAPSRIEVVGKWANTSSVVSAISKFNDHSGDYDTGSEVVVLGWDPADEHTTNFWEELASVELGSAGDNLSSGTFTAKKYLWVQAYCKANGSINTDITFNNDTATNYSQRFSNDGASDSTSTSINHIDNLSTTSVPTFHNWFIINNTSQEKLMISHAMGVNTASAGTAPNRQEIVAKWANTSSQITEIDLTNVQTGSYDTGSIIKVWGSD